MTSGASSFNPTGKYISSELLEIAIEMAQNGDKKGIRELLQLIVKEDPTDELAWIWYASTSPTIQERIKTLEEFRKRNPENERIRYLCMSLAGSFAKEQKTIADGTFPGNTFACPNCTNTIAVTYSTCPSCAAEVYPPGPLDLSTPPELLEASTIASSDSSPVQLSLLDQLATEPSQSEAELQDFENNGCSKHHLGLALDFYISGDKKSARELLEAFTREDPLNELAWIWYANTFPTPQERIQTLYKYLTLNPQNQRVLAYCKFLRATIETPKISTPAGPSPTYTQSDILFETKLPTSTPDPELGLVDFLHHSKYYQILASSIRTPTQKSKPILIGLSKSARQLRCPNCLRYNVAERYPIKWRFAILNAFIIVITLGIWMIFLLRTETSKWKHNKKFICSSCGYSWG